MCGACPSSSSGEQRAAAVAGSSCQGRGYRGRGGRAEGSRQRQSSLQADQRRCAHALPRRARGRRSARGTARAYQSRLPEARRSWHHHSSLSLTTPPPLFHSINPPNPDAPCNKKVGVDQVAAHRHGADALQRLRRARLLADPIGLLLGALLRDDEVARQAHDQVQVPAVLDGQEGARGGGARVVECVRVAACVHSLCSCVFCACVRAVASRAAAPPLSAAKALTVSLPVSNTTHARTHSATRACRSGHRASPARTRRASAASAARAREGRAFLAVFSTNFLRRYIIVATT